MAEYSFDTNIFIEAWHRRYPRDIFPKLWDHLDELIEDGTIIATEEVKTELEQKADDVLEYVKQRPKLFAAVDDEQQEIVGEIINQFANENWDILNSRKNKADPYVIALAQAKGLTVVTFERNGGPKKVKIPFVCANLSPAVPCIHMLDFMRKIGLTFT